MRNIANAIHTENNTIDIFKIACNIMHEAIISGFTEKDKRRAARELKKLLFKYRLVMHHMEIEEIENTIKNLEVYL